MPQRVRSRRLTQARIPHGLLHRPLKCLVADVMAAYDAASRVARARSGGKNILPRPLAVRRGILACEGVRQVHASAFVREVGLVHGVRASQLLPQWDYQDSWKYSYAVLAALTIAHNDGPALKFDILDAQTHRLEDAHPCAVEKAADQMMRPMQASQHREHLLPRQDDGQPDGLFGALHAVQPRQLVAKHVLVQKKKRALCLILRRGRYFMDDRKVGQKKLDLTRTHRCRMPLAVKTDEAFNPVDVSLFSADAVMPKADPVAYLIEQARGRRRCRVFRADSH